MWPPKLMIGLFLTLTALPSQAVTLDWSGDIRGGYFAKERDQRNGQSSELDEWRLRLRTGLLVRFNDVWSFKLRGAGRYSTEDDNNDGHTKFYTNIPGNDGLRQGDATLDELYISYKPNANQHIKIGRMQTKFELTGVAKKSLDRNDSPNTDITWTDGLYFSFGDKKGWKNHVILQYQGKEGATTVRRSPLNFNDNGSRLTYFFCY